MSIAKIKEQIAKRREELKTGGGVVYSGGGDGPTALSLFQQLVELVEEQERRIRKLEEHNASQHPGRQ
ncbi:MAG TPA: hypothetical protein VK797_17145 [Tepidisphaeraceae bacterium]|jgi:hypothetical protein|nr:hypothetical protein [Tepidisphaeraceae bacterium]